MESNTNSKNLNIEEIPLKPIPNSQSDENPSNSRPDTVISQISRQIIRRSNSQTEQTFCQKWIAWIIATVATLFTILVRSDLQFL